METPPMAADSASIKVAPFLDPAVAEFGPFAVDLVPFIKKMVKCLNH